MDKTAQSNPLSMNEENLAEKKKILVKRHKSGIPLVATATPDPLKVNFIHK